MLVDLRPALFLDTRPAICTDASRLGRFGGRTVVAPPPLAVTNVVGCFALDGGRFAEREGDGDDLEELTPLVWMPAGTGRLAFVGIVGGGTAVTVTGAIAAAVAARYTPENPPEAASLPNSGLRSQGATRAVRVGHRSPVC